MSELQEIQRRVAAAIMHPLTRQETMPRRRRDGTSNNSEAEALIKPNDRLTSFERLEIYNRQYWFRVLDALDEDFAGLRSIVGRGRFDALCEAYLEEYPSSSFTMRNLGARLESWLRAHTQWIRPRVDLALDMVRLEWAEIEAFDAAGVPALAPEDVSHLGADPTFTLQPALQLLELRYPVDNLLLAVRGNHSDDNTASNAISTRKRSRVHKVANQKPQSIFLAVHRLEYSVYFKRLDKQAFALLRSLREGKTLSAAVVHAFAGQDVGENQLLSTVQGWFENWSTLGWFCRSGSAKY